MVAGRQSLLLVPCRGLSSQAGGRQLLERIVRVDHAGELGATYIYKGDLT